MEHKERALIYARVSSKEQEVTGYSLEAQTSMLEEYAERSDLDVVKKYRVSESASGKEIRKVFTEALDYADSQGINVVLCEKIDRLTRNLTDAVTVRDWVQADDARAVHCVKEAFILDKNTKAHDNFVWNMKIAVASFYTDNLSEEVIKGQNAKIKEGWMPTTPPHGYKTIGDKGKRIHVPNDQTALLIQLMFQEFASGNHTVSSITDFIYEKGLRSRKGNRIARSRIHSLLQDPFYYGDFRWKETIHNGQHEPLITKETYDKVQDTLHNRNTGKNFKHDYLFKGLVTCHECGGRVTWEKQKGIVYGHCSAYQNCVKRPWYKEDNFTAAVQEQLNTLKIAQPRLAEWVTKALKHVHAEEIGKQGKVIEGLRNHHNRLRQRKDMLYNDRLDSRISEQEYDSKASKIDKEQKGVERAMSVQQSGERTYYELAEAILELSQRASEIFVEAKPTKQKRLLSLICQEIYVEDGKLHLNFTEEFRMLKELALQLNSSKAEKPVVSPIQIFELAKCGSNKEQGAPIEASCPTLLPLLDKFRTLNWREIKENFECLKNIIHIEGVRVK